MALRPARGPAAGLALLLAAALAAGLAGLGRPAAGAASRADIPGACGGPRPFFAATRFSPPLKAPEAAVNSAILAFRDTPGEDPADPVILATVAKVGAVFGLAYDAARNQLYAAAYHKRASEFGPGGPGAIYRVDLGDGSIIRWASLNVGPEHHDQRADDDAPAAAWVGRASLGDIDLAEDGAELYVASLFDGRIYRLSVPEARTLGAFAHGAAGTGWARSARLFGLAVRDGWLYHGVVDSRGESVSGAYPVAFVYRSRPDGGQMTEVARVDLNYPRVMPWGAWDDVVAPGSNVGQPMLVDLELRADGELVLGLRDRAVDLVRTLPAGRPYHVGDLLPARPDGEGWQVITQPERYQDQTAFDEASFGSLAAFPGLDWLAATGLVPGGARDAGALWFDHPTGARMASERLASGSAQPNEKQPLVGLGDLEALCGRRDPDPDLAATVRAGGPAATQAALATQAAAQRTAAIAQATAAAGTRTAEWPTVAATLTAGAPRLRATMTAAAATGTFVAPRTATPAAARYQAIRAACPAGPAPAAGPGRGAARPAASAVNPYVVTTIFARDTSPELLAGEPAIVGLKDTPDNLGHLDLAWQPQVGATWGLAYDWRRGQLYAGAYLKRGAAFGPAGPGGLYRLDLASGHVRPWAVLDAGLDPHDLGGSFDAAVADWVGRMGLGDIDLSEDGKELFAMNLHDGRVWRLSVPDGALLGSFAHGAAGAAWAAEAHPFALALRDGRVYHGVVRAQMNLGDVGPLTAHVYSSWPDGTDLREELALDLRFGRGASDWRAWGCPGAAGVGFCPGSEPMLADLEFSAAGDLVLGFRDRQGDSAVAIGYGDLVPARALPGGGWRAAPLPEFYQDRTIHDESVWGGLALLPGLDELVSSALAPELANSGGLFWHDNADGRIARTETVYSMAANPGSPTFNKAQGLGDVEVLCPPASRATLTPSPTPPASPTPTASDTATASPSPSPSPSATPSRRPSATPTPACPVSRRPCPVYLPLLLGERCEDILRRADVALVIDVSTSMRRPTRNGRPKLEAVQEAARLFLERVDLDAGDGRRDQVAIVGFNDGVWVQQPLTADRAALLRAVDALPARMAEGSRLDRAIAGGQGALAGPAREPANSPVLVLLTDGLPNRVPTPVPAGSQEDTVRALAAAAKAAGLSLYTIGVGRPDAAELVDRIDEALLAAVASRPDMFYQTPDAEDLARIYGEVATTLRCPAGRHDWGRPWP